MTVVVYDEEPLIVSHGVSAKWVVLPIRVITEAVAGLISTSFRGEAAIRTGVRG
tara:strand:- start:216 stop:377 length:162 start_codon:yes stop_codon:yes gene_type:complete